MSELIPFLCLKLYSLNFAIAHAQKRYTCVALIDSFHIVSAHAPNSLVPRYLREIILEGATFIRLPMHYIMEYEKR